MPPPRTIGDTLGAARRTLEQALALDPREAGLEAHLLLGHALGRSRSWLVAHGREPIPAEALTGFEALLRRRLDGEPVAYLLGRREFFGLELLVTPEVLIPRPETELLVELALAHLPGAVQRSVLDLGTGSGAVALAIAGERPKAAVTAVDALGGALAVAQANARRLGLDRVRFLLGDWFSPFAAGERFDLIVGNPPYVAADDPHLAALRFEPRQALAAGPDGLDALRTIIATAPKHLAPGGVLLLEHGHDQGAACRDLFAQAGFGEIATHRDLSGLERVTLGRLAPWGPVGKIYTAGEGP